MSEEKLKVLQMIQDGKITVEEGMELLDALGEKQPKEADVHLSGTSERFLRVRVDNTNAKVNVNVPLSLLKVASKLVNVGMNFVPEHARKEMESKGVDISKIDFDELVNLIDQGLVNGKLVDIDAEDPRDGKTKVEVYVE